MTYWLMVCLYYYSLEAPTVPETTMLERRVIWLQNEQKTVSSVWTEVQTKR
jgi:hypothetical protein